MAQFKAVKKPMVLPITSAEYGDFEVTCKKLSQSEQTAFLDTPGTTKLGFLSEVIMSTKGLSDLDDNPIAIDDVQSALALFNELPDLANGVFAAYFQRLSPEGSGIKVQPAGSGRMVGTPKSIN